MKLKKINDNQIHTFQNEYSFIEKMYEMKVAEIFELDK